MLILLSVPVGCGAPAPVERDIRDPIIFAGNIKSRVVTYIDRITRNPQHGQSQTNYLIEFLQATESASAPLGESESLYRDLMAGCKELQSLYGGGSSSDKGSKKAKLAELKELAMNLPGDLVIEETW